MQTDPPKVAAARWVRYGLVFLWLATGLGVLHPYYREQGRGYLAPLGLPEGVMVATCLGEIALGLWLALGRSARVWGLQAALISGFTATLLVTQPQLIHDPYGMLTKNLPLLALVGAGRLLEREGWTPRAEWLLRGGVAVVWVTEGLLPKILVPHPEILEPLVPFLPGEVSAATLLPLVGCGEILAGLGALLLRGRWLRLLLLAQVAGLAVFPLIAAVQQPLLLAHPFGPLTKNVPILVGTVLALRRTAQKGN